MVYASSQARLAASGAAQAGLVGRQVQAAWGAAGLLVLALSPPRPARQPVGPWPVCGGESVKLEGPSIAPHTGTRLTKSHVTGDIL